MARNTKKKKAQVNKQLWEKANSSHRQRWQFLSQKGYDFYLNEQLTKDEQDALDEAGMPTFVINRVTPIIETMKYFVTANNPRWMAVGAEGSDVDIAQVHSDIADYCWYHSNGKSVYSQVVLDALTKGIGYFLVHIDKDADMGKGEVKFSRLNPYDVFVDPMSRDFLFRDASFITICKNLSRTQLMNLYPEFSAKIKKASKDASATVYSQRDRNSSESVQPEDITMGVNLEAEDDDILAYYETYKKKKFPFVNLFLRIPPTPEELKQIQKEVDTAVSEFTDEVNVSLEEKKVSIQQALQAGEIIPERAELEIENAEKMSQEAIAEKKQELTSQAMDMIQRVEQKVVTEKEYEVLSKNSDISKNIVDAVKFYESRIELTCTIGDDVLLYEYIQPIQEYPIVPFPYMYTGTPYPMSAVTPLVGKQQEINKAHQIMLHNANLASNLRWMYEEGSVPEEEWEQYSSSPGALLKYRSGFAPPTPVLPAPINNAFYTVVQEGKVDAEYIAGIPSSMMGFAQDQPETYRGMLANDEFGTRRLKAWMGSVVEPALEHLGRVFQKVAQSTYSIDKVFRIVQPEAGQQQTEEKEQRINVPIYNDFGDVIGKWMDYGSAKFDIRIIAGTTMPVNRWALLEEYFRWFQAGLIDDIAMIAETDIRNKKNIINRNSMLAKLKSQLEQMDEAIKDKDGTIETLERQLVQAGIKMRVKDAEGEVRKDVLETEAQQKLLRNMMKNEFDSARKDIQRGVQKAEDDAKNKQESD